MAFATHTLLRHSSANDSLSTLPLRLTASGFLVNTGTQTPARIFTPRENVTTRHLRRFMLYVALALWRTHVLYKVRAIIIPCYWRYMNCIMK
jgi:hypothetical protein